ncbi:MAG: cyclic nucleotide-binding domain-containing protein [Coriobacteriia bacterium]|nr:cyclic nucleotide-binding domain-containing protein [Coriobacteriia bacterium]
MTTPEKHETYSDGDVIIRQGEGGDRMFVVESGTVRIYRTIREVETVLDDLRAGEMFGEMALLDNRARSASARAVGPVAVRVITRDEFADMKCDPVLRELLTMFGRRLRSINDAFERLNVNEVPQREELAQLWESRDWSV